MKTLSYAAVLLLSAVNAEDLSVYMLSSDDTKILAGSKESICTGSHNIVLGFRVDVTGNNNIVIGDEITIEANDQILVGVTCCGEKIPEDVRDSLRSNPEAVRWLINTITKHSQESQRQFLESP